MSTEHAPPSADEPSLEGWDPSQDGPVDIPAVIDLAFDYRGNVTIERADGTNVAAYVSNRDARAARPFLDYFDVEGRGPFRMPYAEISNIRFTGKDTAKGNSYEAYQRRKAAEAGQG